MQQHDSKYFARRPPIPHPNLGGWSKGLNTTFLEYGHVAYRIKGKWAQSIFSPYTHPQPVVKNLNMVILHIKLRGKKNRLT